MHYMFTAESDGERILKIGQHLPKLWAIKYRVVFYETPCDLHNLQLRSTQNIASMQQSVDTEKLSQN